MGCEETRMPTPQPPKMKPPKDDQERLARLGAVKLVETICRGLHNCAYGTRSHMPGNVDSTDFMSALYMVTDFCNERPDWTLEIVTKALGER